MEYWKLVIVINGTYLKINYGGTVVAYCKQDAKQQVTGWTWRNQTDANNWNILLKQHPNWKTKKRGCSKSPGITICNINARTSLAEIKLLTHLTPHNSATWDWVENKSTAPGQKPSTRDQCVTSVPNIKCQELKVRPRDSFAQI